MGLEIIALDAPLGAAKGDACLWINTQTLHARDPFPPDQDRVLRHVNIMGDPDPLQIAV